MFSRLKDRLNKDSKQDGHVRSANVFRLRFWTGINLGSWFTLERWITPHPFEGTSAQSELALCQSLPSSALGPRLLEHWQSFVTEEDFRWLAQRGVNTLRLPVSYYHLAGLDPSLLNGTPYEPYKDIYAPAWELITRAITLARSHGLGVLLDLHGVPGGQNDDAHSGQDGSARLWEEKSWRGVTGRCLERMVKELRGVENVVGVELMNEPKQHPRLASFQRTLLEDLRKLCPGDFALVVGDSWDLDGAAKTYFPTDEFTMLDTHVYRCFTPEDARTPAQDHAARMRDYEGVLRSEGVSKCSKGGGRVIVGEFSGALNPGSMGGSTGGEADEKTRQFVRAQLEVFERTTSGYFFWTYKKVGGWDAGWSFRDQMQAEILPDFLGRRRVGGGGGVGDGEGERGRALAAHVGYWDGVMGDKARKMEHDRFEEGFRSGWTDQAFFLSSPLSPGLSELPAGGGQWKVLRFGEHVRRRGGGEWVWEWEQGWEQGVRGAKEGWRG